VSDYFALFYYCDVLAGLDVLLDRSYVQSYFSRLSVLCGTLYGLCTLCCYVLRGRATGLGLVVCRGLERLSFCAVAIGKAGRVELTCQLDECVLRVRDVSSFGFK